MLHFSLITNPSPLILRRSAAMWANKIGETESTVTYRVTPFGADFDHQSKDRRSVTFDLDAQTAECVSLETGKRNTNSNAKRTRQLAQLRA